MFLRTISALLSTDIQCVNGLFKTRVCVQGRFPLDEKYSGNFLKRMEKHFLAFQEEYNFARSAQFSEMSYQKFPFHSIFFPEFQELLVAWFAFRNSTIYGLSEYLPRKFPYHLSPFQNLRNFSLNGKRA